MKTKYKVFLGVALAAVLVAVTGWYLSRHSVPVLQPRGEIGNKERSLIIFVVAIAGVVVIPVFGLLAYFGWKYREGNHKAKYTPDLGGSKLAESIWWLVPGVILLIISVVTWQSSYALDPFKPIASDKPTLHIQVVALDWKWLFIYPDQQIASVNEAAIPVGTPVDFEITSDSVMTSFWAPQLGGQMYAMPGMSTQLNLLAAKAGSYNGVAANISGKGFADMKFTLKALGNSDYDAWQSHIAQSSQSLTQHSYDQLAKPSQNNKPEYFSTVHPGLYDTIVMKYMMPMSGTDTDNSAHMHGMAM